MLSNRNFACVVKDLKFYLGMQDLYFANKNWELFPWLKISYTLSS